VVTFETDPGAAGSQTVSQISHGRKNRLWFSFHGSEGSYEFNQESPDSFWVGGLKQNSTCDKRTGVGLHPQPHKAGFQYSHEDAEKAGYVHELEVAIKGIQEMRRRGIRVLPGGDYGFAWTPHGTYARDLEHFVNLFGYTEMETIIAATALGGELFQKPNELGKVLPGFYADLILVDGNPLEDITVLQDINKITAVMKNGEFHRAPAEVTPATPEAAASNSPTSNPLPPRSTAAGPCPGPYSGQPPHRNDQEPSRVQPLHLPRPGSAPLPRETRSPNPHAPTESRNGSVSQQQQWKSANTEHTSEPQWSTPQPRTQGCSGCHRKAWTHECSSTNATDTKCGSTRNSFTTHGNTDSPTTALKRSKASAMRHPETQHTRRLRPRGDLIFTLGCGKCRAARGTAMSTAEPGATRPLHSST
jgi:hypothetical protein